MLSKAFQNNIPSDALPNGQMHYNIANRILNERLGNNYALISESSVQIQKGLNTNAGIGLNADKPSINQDRIDGIVNMVSSEPYENVSWILNEPIVNFSQSVVDDVIKANVLFHYQSGLNQ